MNHLFAYGTLMCEEIMTEVCGLKPTSVKAQIRDYARRAVRGEHYPAIRPFAGAHVEGIIYVDLPIEAWKRLDNFEGEMYERKRVEVISEDNSILEADTYVIRPSFQHLLSSKEWDYKNFLRTGKSHFQRLYMGYSEL